MGKPADDTLWGSGDLVAALGIDRSVLKYWRDHRPDFPQPQTLSCGDVWRAADVRKWFEENVTRQGRRLGVGGGA